MLTYLQPAYAGTSMIKHAALIQIMARQIYIRSSQKFDLIHFAHRRLQLGNLLIWNASNHRLVQKVHHSISYST